MQRKFKIVAALGAVAAVGLAVLIGLPLISATNASSASTSAPIDATTPPAGNHPVSIPLAAGPYPAQCPNGYVALTFDNGPTKLTPQLVATLRQLGVKATFFDWGDRVLQYPKLVRQQAAQGWVGNHSFDHPDLESLSDKAMFNQLLGTNQIIEKVTGNAPTLFRPPFDDMDWEIAHAAESLGMTPVEWTTDSYDYTVAGDTPAKIVANAEKVAPGGIILFHDGYQATIKALPAIVDNLASRGLCAGQILPSATPTVTSWDETFYAEVGHW